MWFEHNDMDDLDRLLHEQKEKDDKVCGKQKKILFDTSPRRSFIGPRILSLICRLAFLYGVSWLD